MASTTLTGEEWKALCLVNISQMQQFFNTVPGVMESGASGLTPELLLSSLSHIERLQQFLTAWSKSRAVSSDAPATEAVSPRKRGWPKGKPRTKKPQPEEQAS